MVTVTPRAINRTYSSRLLFLSPMHNNATPPIIGNQIMRLKIELITIKKPIKTKLEQLLTQLSSRRHNDKDSLFEYFAPKMPKNE